MFFKLYLYPITEEKGSKLKTANKNLSESEFSNVALGAKRKKKTTKKNLKKKKIKKGGGGKKKKKKKKKKKNRMKEKQKLSHLILRFLLSSAQ